MPEILSVDMLKKLQQSQPQVGGLSIKTAQKETIKEKKIVDNPVILVAPISENCFIPSSSNDVQSDIEQKTIQNIHNKLSSLSDTISAQGLDSMIANTDPSINSMARVLLYLIDHLLPEQLAALNNSAQARSRISQVMTQALRDMAVMTIDLADQQKSEAMKAALTDLGSALADGLSSFLQGAAQLGDLRHMNNTSSADFEQQVVNNTDKLQDSMNIVNRQTETAGLNLDQMKPDDVAKQLLVSPDGDAKRISDELELTTNGYKEQINRQFRECSDKLKQPGYTSTAAVKELTQRLQQNSQVYEEILSPTITSDFIQIANAAPKIDIDGVGAQRIDYTQQHANEDAAAFQARSSLADDLQREIFKDGRINPMVKVGTGANTKLYVITDQQALEANPDIFKIVSIDSNNTMSKSDMTIRLSEQEQQGIQGAYQSAGFMLQRSAEVGQILSATVTPENDDLMQFKNQFVADSQAARQQAVNALTKAKAVRNATTAVKTALQSAHDSLVPNAMLGGNSPLRNWENRRVVMAKYYMVIASYVHGFGTVVAGALHASAAMQNAHAQFIESLIRILTTFSDALSSQGLKLVQDDAQNFQQILESVIQAIRSAYDAAQAATQAKLSR